MDLALVLDYGNVLTLPQDPDAVAAMAARLGVAIDAFTSAYWEHRRPYDAGDYAAPDYWRQVLRSLRALRAPRAPGADAEGPEDPALFDWLTARDGEAWTRYRDEVWDLARAVRATGARTAMLSNMSVELAAYIRRERALDAWFDVVVVSGEARCIKPDPRIYRLCLERLEVEAPRALFVDDRPENAAAAASLGMQTLHFAGDDPVAELRRALERRR